MPNAYASKICAGKIKDPSGKKRKDWGPKKMNKGGGADMSKVKTKKKNILDKVTDKLNKTGEAYKKLGEAGLNVLRGNVPVKKSVGGGADMSTIKKKKNFVQPTPIDMPEPAPKKITIPKKIKIKNKDPRKGLEFKKGKPPKGSSNHLNNPVVVREAKVGKLMTAGSQSAMGRLEKSGMRGGGIAIKGTNFKGVF